MERREELVERGVAALERLAAANEELIHLAKDERDFGDQVSNQPGPPFCPHCERVNPLVLTQAEGEGLLSNFVLVMRCANCQHTFYGLVDSWTIAPDVDTAKAMRDERNGGNDKHS